jgi:hypothetical protein
LPFNCVVVVDVVDDDDVNLINVDRNCFGILIISFGFVIPFDLIQSYICFERNFGYPHDIINISNSCCVIVCKFNNGKSNDKLEFEFVFEFVLVSSVVVVVLVLADVDVDVDGSANDVVENVALLLDDDDDGNNDDDPTTELL